MRRKDGGVFPDLIDRKAFFDTVVLSIWGKKRESPGKAVRGWATDPIGGRQSNYARVGRAVLGASGNSFDLKFGPMRLQKIIPPLVLVLHSDRTPVTVENMETAMAALCEKGWRASVSQVELTFDMTRRSVGFFDRRIFTSARSFKWFRDEEGGRTLYVGGRTSTWQTRVYQKAPGVVRFEFIARRSFLREHRIELPSHLRLFRDIDLRPRIRLREIDGGAMKSVEASIEPEFRRRLLTSCVRNLPHRDFIPYAKRCFRAVLPQELLVPSRVEEQQRLMQWRLVL